MDKQSFSTNKNLTVITVTYNNEGVINDYLDSLKNLPRISEVVIIDNNSTDNTVNILKKRKEIKLIESMENLGFSKACNLGAKNSNGEYLLFLNPDTKILDNAISKLLEFYKSHKNSGVVAPQLIEADGSIQPSVRKFPTVWGAIEEFYLGKTNAYEAYVPEGSDPIKVDAVFGAAMLIERQVFNVIGGFDEKYFMYYEDIDLCKKIKQRGLEIYYIPGSKVIHKVGGSISLKKLDWIKQSTRIYHGYINNFFLYLVLRPRRVFKKILGIF